MKYNKEKSIYLVLSNNKTFPEWVLKKRAELEIFNRKQGDSYIHIALSFDKNLNDMVAFTRKNIYNMFEAGLAKESLETGIFARQIDVGECAVIEINVTEEQYLKLEKLVKHYWDNKEKYRYNYLGLISMVLRAKGARSKHRFFCSEWIVEILNKIDIKVFENIPPYDVRPFDFYEIFKENIIYEGKTNNYIYNPNINITEEIKYEDELLYI